MLTFVSDSAQVADETNKLDRLQNKEWCSSQVVKCDSGRVAPATDLEEWYEAIENVEHEPE